jgi:hypothetical protein
MIASTNVNGTMRPPETVLRSGEQRIRTMMERGESN